jgi:hypothetical protein
MCFEWLAESRDCREAAHKGSYQQVLFQNPVAFETADSKKSPGQKGRGSGAYSLAGV